MSHEPKKLSNSEPKPQVPETDYKIAREALLELQTVLTQELNRREGLKRH